LFFRRQPESSQNRNPLNFLAGEFHGNFLTQGSAQFQSEDGLPEARSSAILFAVRRPFGYNWKP
jgi:hypothetical protein